jgi:hypothetical protein
MARLVDECVGTRDGECVGGVRLAIALMANVWATSEAPSSAGGPAYSPCTRNGEDRILARCGIQTSFYRRKAQNLRWRACVPPMQTYCRGESRPIALLGPPASVRFRALPQRTQPLHEPAPRGPAGVAWPGGSGGE